MDVDSNHPLGNDAPDPDRDDDSDEPSDDELPEGMVAGGGYRAEDDIDELFDEPDEPVDPDADEDAEWEQMQIQAAANLPHEQELREGYVAYLEAHDELVERQARTRYRIVAVGALAASAVMGWGVYDQHIDKDEPQPKPSCAQQIEDSKERYAEALRKAQAAGKPAPEYKSPSCAR